MADHDRDEGPAGECDETGGALGAARQAARQLAEQGDLRGAVEVLEQTVVGRTEETAPLAVALLRLDQARLLIALGHVWKAHLLLRRAAPVLERAGREASLTEAHLVSAAAFRAEGRADLARRHLEDARKAAKRSGDPALDARVLQQQAALEYVTERVAASLESLDRALDLSELGVDDGLVVSLLTDRATVLLDEGRVEEAAADVDRAEDLSWDDCSPTVRVQLLMVAARAHTAQYEDAAGAVLLLHRALELAREADLETEMQALTLALDELAADRV